MSAASAPFGFVAHRHPTGKMTAVAYTIAAAYAVAISKNQPVTLLTAGTIAASAAATDILGVFVGVEYIDALGKPCVSTNWPVNGVVGATNIRAWVYDDPEIEFLVQADGSIAATALGDQADISNATNAARGRSTATLSATLAGAAAQGQFRITGIDLSVDNAAGDAFTKVIVKIARHQFVAAKVAI